MTQSLEDIRYLSDSEHRIVALGLLLEGPKTQGDLRAGAEASSATVSRMLRSFEERDWVVRRAGSYELTSIGRFVTTEFTHLQDQMDAMEELQKIIEWIPADVVALGLECLVDAAITFPSAKSPLAPPERATELKRHSSRSRGLSYYLPTMCIAAHQAAIEEGIQTLEAVFTEEMYETIACSPSTGTQQFIDVIESDRATLYVSDEEIPYVIGINDDIVYLGINNEMGIQVALMETTNEQIFAWAEETFEEYRKRARPITSDEFHQLAVAPN